MSHEASPWLAAADRFPSVPLPLGPGEGALRLYLAHVSESDGRDFAWVFREAWDALPLSVCRPLVDFWKRCWQRPLPLAYPDCPLFLLANDLTHPVTHLSVTGMSKGAAAFCWSSPRVWRLGSRDLCRCAVAHELCHGYVLLRPKPAPTFCGVPMLQASWQESRVDSLLEEWGFPGRVLRSL
jgi:hypothetical protein